VHVVSLSCGPVPPAGYGGIELVVAHLCEGLAELGANVTCYSPGDLGLKGVAHERTLPTPSPSFKEGGLPNTRDHLTAVQRALGKNVRGGDVVVFNHPDHYRFMKWRLSPVVRWRARLTEVAHWTDVAMSRNIIYPSAALKAEVGRPGTVIPHGQKLSFGSANGQREPFLFFAGRITRDKGVDIALDACKALGVKLVLAGPLNDPEFARTILADAAVEYLGELTYEQLVPWYKRARALVYLTQYTEPFGLSIVEAMAAGCPVLTTGKGGTGETVLEGRTGFFCQSSEDVQRAYHKLGSLEESACVARAREHSVARMAKAYLEYFTSL
jgi:glycosyltransferase involved in cell wall biosynthesis